MEKNRILILHYHLNAFTLCGSCRWPSRPTTKNLLDVSRPEQEHKTFIIGQRKCLCHYSMLSDHDDQRNEIPNETFLLSKLSCSFLRNEWKHTTSRHEVGFLRVHKHNQIELLLPRVHLKTRNSQRVTVKFVSSTEMLRTAGSLSFKDELEKGRKQASWWNGPLSDTVQCVEYAKNKS